MSAMQLFTDPMEHHPWRVSLFGGLRITYQGQPVSPPPFRSQLLLALLLLHPGKHLRDQLAGRLFPDSPEPTARARLSDHLWLLKNHLPSFPLSATAVEICVDMGQVWVDVNEFRLLIQENDRGALTRALDLYIGDLLPEQDADWLLLERENLYLAYVRSLQALITLILKSGHPLEAVPLLEKLQALEPFDENNLRSLLRTYQAVGQRGAALAAFDHFRIRLKNELDLEPEPATMEFIQAIRTQTMPPPPPSETAGLPSDPQALFKRGLQALWCGDFPMLQACIHRLEKPAGEVFPGAADSLQADYAILCGDYDPARQLLGKYREAVPLPVLVRQIHLQVELKDFPEVVDCCKAAILEAHRQKDYISEMLLLADQGLAYQRTGNTLEAMRCANQIITQAEKGEQPCLLVRGLLLKGTLQVGQGFERDALETFHHAAAYASENNFLPLLSRAEGKLGLTYQNAGKYHSAIQHYEKALQIARNLGMKRDEAENLQNFAIVLSCLGRNKASILAIRQARDILATLNDEQGMASNTYHLAFGLAYEEKGGLDESLTLGKQALKIFEKHQSLGWIASVYGMLGYIYWLRNEPQAAIEACEKAIPIYRQLNEADYIPELYGYIGLAYLQKSDPQKALEYTTIAMDEMMRSELYDIASEIYFAHASALDAVGQADNANEYFRRGYQNLLTYAAEIEDPEALQAFFRRDPTVRRLMEQVYARSLAPHPQVQTHLIRARGRNSIPVALTLDAGAPDVVLKNAAGAVALRRVRLRRILHEARLQGSLPSLEQIARLMKVSLRTIQRDIRYLEARGELPGPDNIADSD